MKNLRSVAKQTYNLEKEISPQSRSNSFPLSEKQSFSNFKRSELKAKRTESEANWMPQHPDCLSCGTDITHPLCPNCITKAFNQWTRKFPEHKQIKSKLDTFMKHHNRIGHQSKPCVACQNPVHICPLCFTEYLHQLVKEAGLGVQSTSEFLFIFNFDFEHTGYSQELEAYGGY